MTAGSVLAACQSDGYRIKGEAAMLNDGDTLFVTDDLFTGTPIDTLIVKDGKFETEEEKADSTRLCMVYSKITKAFMHLSSSSLEPSASNCLKSLRRQR